MQLSFLLRLSQLPLVLLLALGIVQDKLYWSGSVAEWFVCVCAFY